MESPLRETGLTHQRVTRLVQYLLYISARSSDSIEWISCRLLKDIVMRTAHKGQLLNSSTAFYN